MVSDDPAKAALIDEVSEEFGELRQSADRLDEAVSAQFGLNRTDLRCLGIIYRRGRVTAGELAEESGLTPGAITTVLDRMERGGYANRVADPGDRRRVLVVSTAATREVGARVYGEVEIAGSTELEGHSLAELGVIRDYLRRLREVYEDQAAHIAAEAGGGAAGASPAAAALNEPEVWAPLGTVTAGQLRFTKGAARLDIRGDAAPGELYRARFEGPAPDVTVHGGTVTFQQRRRFRPFDWRGQSSEVSLNADHPLGGVAARRHVEAHGRSAAAADRSARRGRRRQRRRGVAAASPPASCRCASPAGQAESPCTAPRRPRCAPWSAGGASQIVFDDQRLGALGGNNVLSTPGFGAAADRYEVRLSGGASQVTIDTV